MAEKERNVELRSEKVRNIVGQVPPKLIRYGITTVGLIVVLAAVVSTIIPYRNSIPLEMSITSVPAVKVIYARVSGVLTSFLHETSEKVDSGDVIGAISGKQGNLIVHSPSEGICTFGYTGSRNVNKGDAIYAITPIKGAVYYGEGIVHKSSAQKIKQGMKAAIISENGQQRTGRVISVTPVPLQRDAYVVRVSFPDLKGMTAQSNAGVQITIFDGTVWSWLTGKS